MSNAVQSVHTPPTAKQLSPPLWQLLAETARVVQSVLNGRSLTEGLGRSPEALRPGVQSLAFTTMRGLGLAQAVLDDVVAKPPAPWVRALLLTAMAVMAAQAYPAHTLVNQAVRACQQHARAASGLVNAVLRRYAREQAALTQRLQENSLAARWQHPLWWIERLQRDWPQQWPALLAANNQAAPLMLRINRRETTVADYQMQLHDAGLDSQRASSDGLVLARAVPVAQLPNFEAGHASVQDIHAQWAAPLLIEGGHLGAGARILDACSAPGGKTAHLLEHIDADVLAIDIEPERLVRVQHTLARLKLHATLQAADAATPATWWDGQAFDAILLDAPCSASGIVRRHPDVRWLRRPSDIEELSHKQSQLLSALWPLLKPGGVMLYCTCSVFKAEGQDVIDAFLQREHSACLLPSPGHLLPVVEYQGSGPDAATPVYGAADSPVAAFAGDGFFYALLHKSTDHTPSPG